MAYIGLDHVVGAEMNSHTEGQEPSYGTGFDIGAGIAANLTINRNTNKLYGDNVEIESDNGVTGMSLELNVDDIEDDVKAEMGIEEKVTTGTGTSEVVTYYDTAAAGKKIGVGYIRQRVKRGVTKWEAVWTFSCLFSMNSENSQTKGENIEWGTPTIVGECHGMLVDDSGVHKFRKKRIFESHDAAASYLDGLAGITRT